MYINMLIGSYVSLWYSPDNENLAAVDKYLMCTELHTRNWLYNYNSIQFGSMELVRKNLLEGWRV